jgi:hypothetical protein
MALFPLMVTGASQKAKQREPRTRRAPQQILARVSRPNETTIQIDLVRWLRLVMPSALVWHPANGGWRKPLEAARFQRMGVLPGIPDVIVWTEDGRTITFEVKTPKGRRSPDQIAVHEWMTRSGLRIATVRGIDDARAALAAWEIPTREVVK